MHFIVFFLFLIQKLADVVGIKHNFHLKAAKNQI